VSFAWDATGTATGLVSGYTTTPTTVALFQFNSGSNIVYIYIPFIASSAHAPNVDVVDLTSTSSYAPSTTLSSFNGNSALSAFNFFDLTDYNQWYTVVSATSAPATTVLVSKFVYQISSVSSATTAASTLASTISGLSFLSTNAASTGDKLCYASFSQGNFQSHLREIIAYWFIFCGIFVYWLIYLFSDSITKSCYNK